MEELEKLQKIGAKEISEHTHIALNKIQAILDCDYKRLRSKATTHGLLQILEREYNVNLKAWFEAYVDFWKNYDSKDEENGPMVNFKVTHETIGQNDSKKGMFLGGLILLLLGFVFFAYLNFYEDRMIEYKKLQNVERMESPSIELKNPDDIRTNTEILGNKEEIKIEEQNVPIVQNIDSSLMQNAQDFVQESDKPIMQSVKIVPDGNVWVGIVYLDNNKRTSFIAEEPFEVDLSRPQTIITGHGMLGIHAKGEISNFNSANRMFFAVDEEGNFSQLTQRQYNTHTRGLGW